MRIRFTECLCGIATIFCVAAIASPIVAGATSVATNVSMTSAKTRAMAASLYSQDFDANVPLTSCMQEGSFVSAEGGCMDTSTGLVWGESYYIATGGVTGFPNYYEAVSYCEGSAQGGFSDWHVPTGEELLTAAGNGITNYVDFAHYGNKFSSTTRKGGKEVLSVDLDTGVSNWILIVKPGKPQTFSRIDVHCVR